MPEHPPIGKDKTGFYFLPLIALLLVVLKLYGVIDWSWWWVLSPLVFHAIGIVMILFVLLLMGVAAVLLSTSAVVQWLDQKFNTWKDGNR
jgi:hypothetical protein